MGRTIVAEAILERYLENLLETESFSYGIIIGQPSRQGKDYVVHLAKTPDESLDNMNSQSSAGAVVKSIASIDAVQMIEHGLNALRQLPGSFFVLGMFVVSSHAITEQPEDMLKLKGILIKLVGGFRSDSQVYACTDEYDDGDKLLFHFAGRRSFTCKTFNTNATDAGAKKAISKPVDWKFQDKTTNWQQIETIFDTDYVLPLIRKANGHVNIDDNFQSTVKSINQKLAECLVFVNDEPLNAYDTLEAYHKQKANRSSNDTSVILHGSLFQICKQHIQNDQLNKYNGTIRYAGVICSKVWVHPKQSIADIERFIKKDIMRSMVGRLRILLDASGDSDDDSEASGNQSSQLHELPHRVFYEVPACPAIWFSDYLFRNESDDTVLQSAKDVMDIDLTAKKIFSNFEMFCDGVADNESVLDETDSTDSTTIALGNKATGLVAKENLRLMYILGLIFAVGVLFVSIGIHFIFNYD